MWLARPEDIDRLNEIFNDPAVLPYVSDGQRLDFKISPPSILTFMSENNAMFFVPKGDDWEFHTAFLPEGRGREGLRFAKDVFKSMFDKFGAVTLWTYQPDDAPHASPPLSFGFKKSGYVEEYVRGLGATEWRLTIENWRRKQCQQSRS